MARVREFFAALSQSKMRLRVISAAVMVAVAVAAFAIGGPAVCALALVLAAAMLWEYDAMFAGGKFSLKFLFDLVFVGVPLGAYCLFVGYVPEIPLLAPAACFLVLWFCVSMLGYVATNRPRWVLEALPAIYIGLPMLSAVYIYMNASALALAYVFVITVSTDTGAFVLGSLIRGPKLAPSISPKKTWSGAFGGLFCAFVFGTAFQVWTMWRMDGDFKSAPAWALVSVLLSVLAQAGDLFESRLKRIVGVKDSGRLIPGHGGVLDRFDSFLFVVPFVALLAALFRSGFASP
ncbi:MAG: phosphatidate cytidylyltransferase [Rickettsiales bacterium]|jgi:phosphatidate cytidylyltransferase|nr:phosphatidate cytidylyltransferase [Rickettsiales bacterium]